jgi:quinol monooxygenase YgiN
MPAAPPYVTYSSFTGARIQPGEWEYVYGSLQALKAHVQEYPGCISFDLFAREEEGDVVVHCYTTWDTPEQLEVFLERGYSFARLLVDHGLVEPEETLVMEKIF